MNFKQKSELKDPRISTFLLDSSSTKMHRILEDSEVNIEPKASKEQSSMMLPNFESETNNYMFSMNSNNFLNEKNISEFVHSFNNNNELNLLNPDSKSKENYVSENLFKENIASDNFIDSSKNNEKSFEDDFGPIKKLPKDSFVEENQQIILENISKEDLWNEQQNQEILEDNNQEIREKKDKNEEIIEKEDKNREKEIIQKKNYDLLDNSQKEQELVIEIRQFDKNSNEENTIDQTKEKSKNKKNGAQEIVLEETFEKKPEDLQIQSNFDFKYIKCPKHLKEDISFICNAPDCLRKFMCCKCLVDDIKNQTRHHIIHEEFLIQYDESVFKQEYEKFLTKKHSFDKILNDQDYQLLEKIENGEFSTIVQKKYQNEVKEIEAFLEAVATKSQDVLKEYKTLIKENVAQDAKYFLRDILNNFTSMKDEFKSKSQIMKEMQENSVEIFSKNEDAGNYDKINFFLKIHQENLEDSLFQKFTYFLQNSLKVLKDYTSKESNRALKYEFYINLMNALKIMINEKIPKNLLNSNYSLLLKANVNLSKEENLKEKKQEITLAKETKTNQSITKNDKIYQQIRQDQMDTPISLTKEAVKGVEAQKNNLLISPIERISSKYFYDVDYSLVLDICLIGPTEKNEYFVATCCSKEKFIKIWTLMKDRPPTEHRTLEGHNKSTYKLFYCHQKKWLLSAGN